MRALNLAVGLLWGLAITCGASPLKPSAGSLAIRTKIKRHAKWDQLLTYTVKVSNRDRIPLKNVYVIVRLPSHGIIYPLEEGVKGGEYSSIHPHKLLYEDVLHTSNTLELWGATLPRKSSLTWRIKIRVGGCLPDLATPLRFKAKAFVLQDGGVPTGYVKAPKSNVTIKHGLDCDATGYTADGHLSNSYRTSRYHVMHTSLIDAEEAPDPAPLSSSQVNYISMVEASAYILNEAKPYAEDPVVQTTMPVRSSTDTVSASDADADSFEGIPFKTGMAAPLNPIAAVSPEHLVHLVRGKIAVYDKEDMSLVFGPININTIFTNTGLSPTDPCVVRNNGIPAVGWDHVLKRFVVSQTTLTAPYQHCVAVAPTISGGGPTGKWSTLSFKLSAGQMHANAKLGIFRDGYVFTFDRFTVDGLRDGPVILLILSNGFGADDDGHIHKWGHDDNYKFSRSVLPGGSDSAKSLQSNQAYEMPLVALENGMLHVMTLFWTYTNLLAAKLTGVYDDNMRLPTEPFDPLCQGTGRDCVPQYRSRGGVLLDNGGQDLMNGARFNIRRNDANDGWIDTLVVSHSVQVPNSKGGTNAGVRWYEIQGLNLGDDADSPLIVQQGTFAPEFSSFGNFYVNRWMPTIAMDGSGNIALMYSVSNPDDDSGFYPSLGVATRLASDPLGTMGNEFAIEFGQSDSQTNNWGSFFSMVVDPVDKCTFWACGHVADENGNPLPIISRFSAQCPCTSPDCQLQLES